MLFSDEFDVLPDPEAQYLANKYKNVSCLVTSPDLHFHLQDLELVGGENIVSFQWLGPHFLTFLKYATEVTELCNNCVESFSQISSQRFSDLLKFLDDSASDCFLYGETEHYKNFLEIILSFMPQIREFFTIQIADGYGNPLQASFIDFLFETIGELLNCQAYSNVLVSNQVEVLLKELEFLLTFLLDTMRCNEEEQSRHILREINVVFNEAGLVIHSFFFTTNLVTTTKMDLAISILLERIEVVQEEIKDHCISISMKMNCEIKSLQVAESPSEVSSSQDKSIPMVEEMVVGFEDMTTQIASKLLGGTNYCQIISIVGMGGLGKTTLAKKIYNDFIVHSSVPCHFDKLSWCVVSHTYKKKKLLIDILSSVSNINREKTSEMEDEEELAELLYKNLKGRRYLIVMDDLWDKEAWDELKRLFPEDRNGSRVLFTSRLKNMALEISHVIIEPPLLSPCESWNLLEQNVFKKERCPEELQEIGQQIATNCHGLPLSIITIAGVLSNMEKEESLWQQVAQNLSSYISQKAADYIPTLKLSYMHLPNHLKPCFLYLSAFEEDEEIPVRKLLLLWIAEGFVEKKEHKSLEDEAEEYLMELINRSLLQVSKRRSDNGVKSCTLHDLVLDMCGKMAVEDEIFLFQHQFLISKHCHRLCMDRSHHLSEVLSILYNSEKIRIFNARYDKIARLGIKIMPNLRYLETPSIVSSVERLQNLEVFVSHGSTLREIPTYLLNMPKLRHLCVKSQFGGPERFSKNCDSSRINSLQTLSYVFIDDEEILKCSPNLRKLKCKSRDNSCPDLNFLTHLESLTIYGSRFKNGHSMVSFPSNIKKLTLAEIRLPWRKMSLIGTLPNLEILKLEWRAFEGEIWSTEENEFQKLKFLKLDHLDLEQWNSSYDHFPLLERLVLQDCKKLETIPSEFSYISTLQKIEVYCCDKNVESSAFEIREEQRDYGNKEFDITIDRFWE